MKSADGAVAAGVAVDNPVRGGETKRCCSVTTRTVVDTERIVRDTVQFHLHPTLLLTNNHLVPSGRHVVCVTSCDKSLPPLSPSHYVVPLSRHPLRTEAVIQPSGASQQRWVKGLPALVRLNRLGI